MVEFEVDKTSLWRVLAGLARYVPSLRRQDAIAFQGMWLEVDGGFLTARVTDGIVSASGRLPVDLVGSSAKAIPQPSARAVVATGLIVALLRRLPAGPIRVTFADGRIELDRRAFHSEILGFELGEHARPAASLVGGLRAVLPAPVLAAGLAHVALSQDLSEWTAALAGAEVVADEGSITFTATDRRSLAQTVIATDGVEVAAWLLGRRLLLAPAFLRALVEHLSASDSVELILADGAAEFRTADASLQAPLLTELFVEYGQVIDRPATTRIALDRAEALAMFERVGVLAEGPEPVARLALAVDELEVRVDGGEWGEAREHLPARLDGPACVLALPLWPTVAFFRQLRGAEVALELGDPEKPVRFSCTEDPMSKYYVMPVIPTGRPSRLDRRRSPLTDGG